MLIIKSIIYIFLCPYWAFTFADENADHELDDFLRYNVEEKLEKNNESFDDLKLNIKYLMKTIKTMEQELSLLRQDKEKQSPSFAEENGDLNVLEVKCINNRLPESCNEVNKWKSDIYNIMIPTYSNHSVPVVCELNTDKGGWTVIQRRQDGSVDFYRNWSEYVKGFGNLNGEFFIGLEKLHALTTQQPQELYIQLEDFEGDKRYAKYTNFKIDSAENDYSLTVDGYSGDAGDSLSYHSGQKFSTWDHDETTCAEYYEGAWWFFECHESNLNGKYLMGQLSSALVGHGIVWGGFRGYDYSLKFSQMMIRPRIE